MKKNKATAATATAEPVETVPAQPGANALASRLISQYRRVEAARGQFVREATAFGITMMRAEARISTAVEIGHVEKGRAIKSKNGLFAGSENRFGDWLAEHCPEINYKTVMSYRALALKMIALMGGASPEVMAALAAPSETVISYTVGGYGSGGRGAPALPGGDVATVPEVVIKAREAIFADATSRRKLEQMYFDFARREEKAEMMAASAAAPLPKITRTQAAERIWARLANELAAKTARDAVPFLPAKVAGILHGQLLEILKMLKEQMAVKD